MSTPPNQLPPTPSGLSPSEIREMVQGFLAKGTAEQQIATLMSENFQHREKVRQLTEQLNAASGKVPADGSIVLVGDDVKIYNEFIALKLKPAEITTQLAEMATLKGKVEAAELQVSLQAAAAAENYDPTVLGTLIGNKKLVVKKVDEEIDGEKKNVDRAFILTEDANKVVTEERLSKHIADHHSKFISSLMVEEEESAGTGGANSGTQFPRQRASSGAKGTKIDASQAYLNKKYRSSPAQGAAK